MPLASRDSLTQCAHSERRRGLSCSKCGRFDLTASDFNADRTRPHGRQRNCRVCTRDEFRRWYQRNRAKPRPAKEPLTGWQQALVEDHANLALTWPDEAGAAWIALQDAARCWKGVREFPRFAKVAIKRAIWRARYADAGYVWRRHEWIRREVAFTDMTDTEGGFIDDKKEQP